MVASLSFDGLARNGGRILLLFAIQYPNKCCQIHWDIILCGKSTAWIKALIAIIIPNCTQLKVLPILDLPHPYALSTDSHSCIFTRMEHLASGLGYWPSSKSVTVAVGYQTPNSWIGRSQFGNQILLSMILNSILYLFGALFCSLVVRIFLEMLGCCNYSCCHHV